METETSLTHSIRSTTCPYPNPNRSTPCCPIIFPDDSFYIILPSMPSSSKWSLTLRIPQQNAGRISPRPIRSTCPVYL